MAYSDYQLSITVNGTTYKTWDNWHLVPTSRPLVVPPSIKTNYVDLPGTNGMLDLTTYLTGAPLYNNREGSFEFMVIGSDPSTGASYGSWISRYQTIMNALAGKSATLRLADDPNYYYTGRLWVSDWTSNNDGSGSTITFDYNLEPYKKSNSGTKML